MWSTEEERIEQGREGRREEDEATKQTQNCACITSVQQRNNLKCVEQAEKYT